MQLQLGWGEVSERLTLGDVGQVAIHQRGTQWTYCIDHLQVTAGKGSVAQYPVQYLQHILQRPLPAMEVNYSVSDHHHGTARARRLGNVPQGS